MSDAADFIPHDVCAATGRRRVTTGRTSTHARDRAPGQGEPRPEGAKPVGRKCPACNEPEEARAADGQFVGRCDPFEVTDRMTNNRTCPPLQRRVGVSTNRPVPYRHGHAPSIAADKQAAHSRGRRTGGRASLFHAEG